MNNKNKKLCYILPLFNLETDTHYFYLYDFINEIAKDLDLVLLIEKSNSDVRFFKNISKIYVQKFSRTPLRIIENFILLLIIRIKNYKNFYIHYSYISAFNASLIARLSRARTFYWNCGMMWLFGRDRRLELILKFINYLVTGVETLKLGYVKHYNISKEKVIILPNWIDLRRFKNVNINKVVNKYKLNINDKYILFVHRLAKRKGVHYIAKLAENNQKFKFLIVGDGPYKEKLKQEIKNLNNVILLGKVPNKYIPALMKISKLFFMPSEEEGFPRVILESMAAGLPYVSFDIGGVKEISAKEQEKYIVKDIDAMNLAIRDILNDNIYDIIKKVNLEHVRQFDIKVVKNKFIELI